jgi:hypothetical protein
VSVGDRDVDLIIGVVAGLLIAWLIHRAVVWCRAWWYRWLGRRGEASAVSLLKAAGYTILDDQLRLPCSYLVDGEVISYSVRVDFLVEKAGHRYVAEAKNGPSASDPRTSATRRQLLEYAVVYGAYGVLLVDVPGRRVRVVEFTTIT